MGKDDDTLDMFNVHSEVFGGETYDSKRDFERLKGQLGRVWSLMKDGQWRTLAQIRVECGAHDTEAAISARLRDFRKRDFGGHEVERRSAGGGLFFYRLLVRRG